MNKNTLAAGVMAAVLWLVLPMPAQAQPGQPVQLPAGPGQELVEANSESRVSHWFDQ